MDKGLLNEEADLRPERDLSLMSISSYLVHGTKETGNINVCNSSESKMYRQWMLKAPPLIPRTYISWSSKIGPKRGVNMFGNIVKNILVQHPSSGRNIQQLGNQPEQE